jgi:hypothetical protein
MTGDSTPAAPTTGAALPDLRGVAVIRADDDSLCPTVGVILDRAGTVGAEWVWVVWDNGTDTPPPAKREALDELVGANRRPVTGPLPAAQHVPEPLRALPGRSGGAELTVAELAQLVRILYPTQKYFGDPPEQWIRSILLRAIRGAL